MSGRTGSQIGIIFKINRSRDADRVVHLLLPDGSRFVVLAKGVKKTTSRKAHAVDLLNTVKFSVSTGQKMPLITDVSLLDSHRLFKRDYSQLMFVQALCEIIDIYSQESHLESGIWNNVENMLSLTQIVSLPLLLGSFILRMIYINGDLPKLNEDVLSEEDFTAGEMRYLSTEIGYTKKPVLDIQPISDRIYKTQRFSLQKDFDTIQKIGLEAVEQLKLLNISHMWLKNATGRRTKAVEMFVLSISKQTQ